MKKKHKDNLFWGAVGLVSIAVVVVAAFKIIPAIPAAINSEGEKIGKSIEGAPEALGTAVSALRGYGLDALDNNLAGALEEAEKQYNSSKAEASNTSAPKIVPDTSVPRQTADNASDAGTTQAVYYVNTTDKIYDATGTVIRVKDGDTYVLDIDGAETTIRLIGVDTPESVAPEDYGKQNTQEGIDVSNIVKDTIKAGDTLYIEYDVGRTDTYGRTLAYLYFESGVMVQEWLLSNGYAQVVTIQPNSKYADHFATMEKVAMNSNIGLWNGFFASE